jgi:folate-binding protein YgfZ
MLALHALGLRVGEEELGELEEGGYRAVDTGGGSFLRVVRTLDVSAVAFDLLGDPPTLAGVRDALAGAGAVELEESAWTTLRVEAGRPAFGEDMDEETLPVEAGLGERAIDHGKGCYTGQEVIVRIRDRGHVNRSLRGVRLGGEELPAAGTELFAPEARGERAAGVLTTVVDSPRMGPVALAYVRREVPVPGTVRVGARDGPEARVEELEGGWGPPAV